MSNAAIKLMLGAYLCLLAANIIAYTTWPNVSTGLYLFLYAMGLALFIIAMGTEEDRGLKP